MKIKEAQELITEANKQAKPENQAAYKLGVYFFSGTKGFPQDKIIAKKYFLMSLLEYEDNRYSYERNAIQYLSSVKNSPLIRQQQFFKQASEAFLNGQISTLQIRSLLTTYKASLIETTILSATDVDAELEGFFQTTTALKDSRAISPSC